MFPVGHCADRTDCAAAGGEGEGARGSAETVLEAVFVDGAVAAAGVDGVAVDGPAGVHAPWWCASCRKDAGDGGGLSAVPDADGAVDRGIEEDRFWGGWSFFCGVGVCGVCGVGCDSGFEVFGYR